MKRTCAWLALSCSVVALVSTEAQSAPGNFSVVNVYPALIESPDGITRLSGDELLVTNCATEDVVIQSVVDGSYLGGFVTPGAMVDHMARNWLDGTIWGNVHPMENMPMMEASLVQFSASTGEILQRHVLTRPLPGNEVMGFPMGLAWAGDAVWTQDAENQMLYRIDTDTGEIVDSIPSPVDNGCGLSWDGVCLWIGAFDTYYQIDPATGNIELQFTPPPPSTPTGMRMYTGFSWDGTHVYLDNECPDDTTIYVLDFEFRSDGPCAHSVVGEGETCDIWNARRCSEALECELGEESAWGVCINPLSGTGGAGGAGGAPAADGSEASSGCGCHLAGEPRLFGRAGLMLAALGLLAATRRRRQCKHARHR